MKKLEFKSAVCTSVEQSKRLLELGLKKETADMVYDYAVLGIYLEPKIVDWREFNFEERDIPAWSLARLFEISNSAIHIGLPAMIDRQQPYDYLITTIEDYIKRDCFNKDYLEEKK